MDRPDLDELTDVVADPPLADPYAGIQEATRRHRAEHGCGAYTFSDGRPLLALAQRLRPARVLELGTALGYTACCWADAGGRVDTIEGDPMHVELAIDNVSAAGLGERVTVHAGRFDEVLPGLPGPYEIAFFDGFEPTDSLLGEMTRRLSAPGLLVTTNLRLAGPGLRSLLAEHGETRFVDDDLALTVVADA